MSFVIAFFLTPNDILELLDVVVNPLCNLNKNGKETEVNFHTGEFCVSKIFWLTEHIIHVFQTTLFRFICSKFKENDFLSSMKP